MFTTLCIYSFFVLLMIAMIICADVKFYFENKKAAKVVVKEVKEEAVEEYLARMTPFARLANSQLDNKFNV